MPSSSSSATARAPRRPTHASRRSTNHSTMSTTSSVASDSSRGTSGAATGHHGRGFTTRSDRSAGAGSRETSSLLQGGGRGNASMSAGGAVGGNPMGPEEDEFHFYEFQLFAYRIIYVFQGVFLGLLGPSLSYFSTLALNNAGINSPVASYGSIFSAHGGAALVMSFVSELVLNVSIEMDLMKNLMVGLLLCSGTWYACLPSVAAASGSLGVNVYFIAKGFWTALLNISLNRCTLWIAGDTIEYGRSLVTSMNFAYGFGTVLGPVIACVLDKLHIDMSNAYYGLALAQLIPMGLIIMLPSPRPLYGRTQNQTIIGFEDPTRRVPTVPSPIVGGVFLHVKHLGGSANCNPDTYDPLNNFIILLVTIFSTILFGIQLGLSAFLFDYIGHVLTVATHPLPNEDIVVWCCLLMILFWSSLWLSYVFFSKYMFHAFNTFSIFYLSIVCMVSSFGILFGTETGFACFVITLALFGFALAPLFTLSIHCLTRVINELLIRRVSSLIVFGCGMGEIFIPVLMGFFMGNYSGKTYGSVAVSYIVFILSMCLVGVSSMLLMMVRKKLRELDHPLESLSSASKRGSSAYQRV